jgi:outer membrane lipoprotein LolB
LAADAAQAPTNGHSFGSGFELQGNAQEGTLLLLTPLGSTAAAIQWSPAGAVIQSGGETRKFPTLDQLITHLLGTPVPVHALFAWLAGQEISADGWQVDQTSRHEGRIVARRLRPAPTAELRLVLED